MSRRGLYYRTNPRSHIMYLMFDLTRTLSLVTLAVVVILWARSYRFAEAIEGHYRDKSLMISSLPGRIRAYWPSPLAFGSTGLQFAASSTPRGEDSSRDAMYVEEIDSAFHSVFAHGHTTGAAGPAFVESSWWALAATLAVLPAIASAGRLTVTRRRRLNGRCRTCGYDLRATRDQCPECGSVVKCVLSPNQTVRRLRTLSLGAGLLLAGAWAGQHDFRAGRCRTADFGTLCAFRFDQENGTLSDIPLQIRRLNGERIAVEGYMIPMDQANDGIIEFALVRNLWRAADSRLVQGFIVVRLAEGKSIGYHPDRIRVIGTLHVRVTKDDGYIISVFDMTADSVWPAP